VISLGKEETCPVESLHAHLRTKRKRLTRRSRCFSRSLQALRRAEQLFVDASHQRQRRSRSSRRARTPASPQCATSGKSAIDQGPKYFMWDT
jgi:hypothetical protein